MKELLKELPDEAGPLARADKYAGLYYSQSGEDVVLWRMLKSRRDGFYVDVGAHHPRKFSNTWLLHKYRGWRGVNIDATQSSIDAFNAERPNDINVCSAVSAQRGVVQLRVTAGGARNTISDAQAASVTRKGVEITEVRSVTAAPLAEILRERLGPTHVIDLMNVDVEGLDLEALQSNDWTAFRPRILVVEDFAFRETPAATPIFQFLNGQGYALASHVFDTSIYVTTRREPAHG